MQRSEQANQERDPQPRVLTHHQNHPAAVIRGVGHNHPRTGTAPLAAVLTRWQDEVAGIKA